MPQTMNEGNAPICPDCHKLCVFDGGDIGDRNQPPIPAAWYCPDCGVEVDPGGRAALTAAVVVAAREVMAYVDASYEGEPIDQGHCLDRLRRALADLDTAPAGEGG